MIVTCSALSDFFINIAAVPTILDGAIRINISRRPVDGDGKDAYKFDVFFQATAVGCAEDGTKYLIQFGVKTGRDYEDASQEKKGTETAEQMLCVAREFATERQLCILPGVIGF